MIVYNSTSTNLPALLYDVTDFVTPETGVGHASITVWLRKPDETSKFPYAMGEAQVTAAFESIATAGTTTTMTDSKLAGKYADDYFNGLLIRTLTGTGSLQNLVVTDYTGSSGMFTFATATAPDSTTTYRICKGICDSSGGTDNLFDTILTEPDDYWIGYEVQIIAGTGVGQVRTVSDSRQSQTSLTVSPVWTTTPDTTSVYSLCDKWIDSGNGEYLIEVDSTELDVNGMLTYLVTDGQVEYLDFNAAADVSVDLSDIKSETDKIQTIDSNVDLIKIETDKIPSVKTTVEALPIASEIDTELSGTHGSGSWLSSEDCGSGNGAYNATINVKDQIPINIANAFVTIHNSNDDDSPKLAEGTTDAQGDVTLNIDGNVYVRVSKVGFTFTSTAKNITASGTYNVTGTTSTIEDPSDPDLCRLYLYPITLDNQDIVKLRIYIFCAEKLTKVGGQFIKNTGMDFTYSDDTSPGYYYFDAVQGAVVDIKCPALGIDQKDITVPALATKDLYDLIS